MPKTPPYTEEFKREAVRLCRTSGRIDGLPRGSAFAAPCSMKWSPTGRPSRSLGESGSKAPVAALLVARNRGNDLVHAGLA
jgi:hypothetical protein